MKMQKEHVLHFLSVTANTLIGFTVNPDSSFTSLTATSLGVCPCLTQPPGNAHSYLYFHGPSQNFITGNTTALVSTLGVA